MRRPVVVALALAAGFAMWRQPLTGIRLIRWLDQRSGIDGRSGARVYDRLLAPMAGWLYQRVAADVAMTLGDQVAPIIVDVGTGPGFLLIAVAARCPTATIIGIDPAEPMRVAAARRVTSANLTNRIVVMAGTAERLPRPNTSVDLVVSSLASHHWSEPAAAIRELLRVLRPGARTFIYDVRFAGLTDRELDALARQTGVERAALTRQTLRGGLLRLFARVTFTAPSAPMAP